MTALDDLQQALGDVVGPTHLLVDPDLVDGYVRDWTGRWTGHTAAVVRPGSVEEVQRVLSICHEHGVPVVPQGGNTGLVGGSIPHHGEVVLSLRRLDRLGEVDQRGREVIVGAGVTLAALREHVRQARLTYGVDLASRDSATLGGTIATNAGGMNVVVNGDTRRQVLGLEVVMADGSLANYLGTVVKESMGPDSLRLMVGSEGSLGVITAARLRLLPAQSGEQMVTLIAVEQLGDGLQYVTPGVTAVEFFSQACLDLVIRDRALPSPFPTAAPFYVLIESAGLPAVPDTAMAVVDRKLWSYRETITETINQQGVPTKIDVGIPLARLDEFVTRVERLGLEDDVYLYGHLAEGNFHVNVVGRSDSAEVEDRVLEIVTEMGGAIASEHGIGVAKAVWWRRSTDPAVLAINRRIKHAFDPGGILNPSVFWGG